MPETLMAASADTAECWTRREILQQPDTLAETHALIARDAGALDGFLQPLLARPNLRIVLTGAGTSAFIGDSLAPWLSQLLGRCVESIPTTDLVSSPALFLRAGAPILLVSFGRSGNSPESVAALDLVDARVADVHHLIITCNAEGALAKRHYADGHVILLPEATHDRAFAMTSSFSAMMLTALTAFTGPAAMAERVVAISDAVRAVARDVEEKATALAARNFSRVVYLGSGVFKGLAREAALKLLELSDGKVVTAFDTALGFRHGPKTIVAPDALIVVFLSNDPLTRHYDLDIVEELRADARCGALLTVSAQPGDNADVIVPGMAAATDADLLFPFIVPAQLYALQVSLALGLTPDTPNQNGTVNRVVQGVRIHNA
ncbi:SIS domain-containing protein [Sphingomonas sp. PL-96]|uniref:SIS domain-containing protein n=1 Tax=Sphingomonas sp. PL-96 TaxID=2887201 RepID=UPI001E3BE925|nr:SIS domain-containing protein [Sphingomonas sp. PL-96]MCC2977915.1 SIS domain-containing protein [Sphingomonas sp. PL-96]